MITFMDSDLAELEEWALENLRCARTTEEDRRMRRMVIAIRRLRAGLPVTPRGFTPMDAA
jgi:hypothetical protein